MLSWFSLSSAASTIYKAQGLSLRGRDLISGLHPFFFQAP